MNLLLVLAFFTQAKSMEVRYTDVAPRIDGVLDEVWQQADSAYGFVQFSPYEQQTPSEQTVVYALQDKENLYFAFRCESKKGKPIACLTGNEDEVMIGLDPFGSQNTAYFFSVYGSEIAYDGWILDDGRTYDDSWDGVWFVKVKLSDDYYVVEFKIPFKSIRYKKGLGEWGLQFKRDIAYNREVDYWTSVTQLEAERVSKYGKLTGIDPQASGYYFELYPEAYVRYEKLGEGADPQIKPSASLNLKWDLTPQTALSATAFPDFAQIESDPYQLNLGRYEQHLEERRPFFIEGSDIFRLASFGEDQQFMDYLDIFYSRRVGKSMNGDAVPILGGAKVTHKSQTWDWGILTAVTGDYSRDSVLLERRRGFGVLRGRYALSNNMDLGVLASGTAVSQDSYDLALGLDGVYRNGFNQFILQTAVSDRNDKIGSAFSTGYFGFIGKFLTIATVEAIHDSFDVSEMGYVPWQGKKQVLFSSGPFYTWKKGFWRNLAVAPGFLLVQEGGSRDWSKLGMFLFNPNFRNRWGCNLSGNAGPYYEADTNYLYRSLNLSVWGPLFGNQINFGGNISYSFNYARGFLAYQGYSWLSYRYSIIPPLSISLNGNYWVEWNPDNQIVDTWPMLTPRLRISFSSKMTLEVFDEMVMNLPAGDFAGLRYATNRVGALFSWNFRPKSWIYIALNDFRADEGTGRLVIQDQIGAIKAKYLLYF